MSLWLSYTLFQHARCFSLTKRRKHEFPCPTPFHTFSCEPQKYDDIGQVETVSCLISQLGIFAGLMSLACHFHYKNIIILLLSLSARIHWQHSARSVQRSSHTNASDAELARQPWMRVKFFILLVLRVLWILERTRIHVWHKLWADTPNTPHSGKSCLYYWCTRPVLQHCRGLVLSFHTEAVYE